MLCRFPSRVPLSTLRCPPSSFLSVCPSYSLSSSLSCSSSSSSCGFSRCFSASNNEKDDSHSVIPKALRDKQSILKAAVASALAALLPTESISSGYIKLSRDHLLNQADLPKYAHKWPQLAQLTNSELKLNGAVAVPPFAADHRHVPSTQLSIPRGLSGVSDWSDDAVDDIDFDDAEEEEVEHMSLSQFEDDWMQDPVTRRRIELEVRKQLSEILMFLPNKRANKPKRAAKRTHSTANTNEKVEAAAPLKRNVGRPKKVTKSAPTNSAVEHASSADSSPSYDSRSPAPTAAELAEFMPTSPARAQFYRNSEEDSSELTPARRSQLARLQPAIAALARPKAANTKVKTVRKAVKTTAVAQADSLEDAKVQDDAMVQLDSTKRKRRRKMNRHQYKKRSKEERQRTRTSNKKIHIS